MMYIALFLGNFSFLCITFIFHYVFFVPPIVSLLSLDLKLKSVVALDTLRGREFHILGPLTEKVLAPVSVFVFGTARLLRCLVTLLVIF